jgi:hypothetical protein
MMGGHDRRIAKLEGAFPLLPVIPEDTLLLIEMFFGPERALKVERTGFDGLDAQERQHLIGAIDTEMARRHAAGVAS